MLKDILKPKSEAEILHSLKQIVDPADRFCYEFKFHYEKHKCNSSHIIQICESLKNIHINCTIETRIDPLYYNAKEFIHRNKEIEIVISDSGIMNEYSRLILISGNKVYIK